MKTGFLPLALAASLSGLFLPISTQGGTWTDHFNQPTLAEEWTGNRDAFQVRDGVLVGVSAHPVGGSPLNIVEVAQDSSDCEISCWINVVSPNLRVCTKGALILRHTGTEGYVFALHEATQTVEVYRLSSEEMLLRRSMKIELRRWYLVRAELHGPEMRFFVDGQLVGTVNDTRSASGSVGVAVQDAEPVWFDDFTISGPNVAGNTDGITPPVLSVSLTRSNTVVLRFLASPPYDYFVQSSSAALTPAWRTLGTFRAKLDPFEAEWVESVTNALRLYRVEKVHCECR